MKNQYSPVSKTVIYLLLIFGALLSIAPFYWMFVGATNASGDILHIPPRLLPGKHLIENFKNLQESLGMTRIMFNSLFVSLVSTFLSLLICSAAGYAFAKFKFKGRDVIFFAILLTMMIPSQVTLVPLFKLMVALNWLDTYQAVILPQLAVPFAIFLIRQNMLSFPDDLLKAARIDGAGELRIFFTIVLPTMKPALAAVAIFLFMSQWNSFIWPLVVLSSPDMYTLPVALSSLIGLARIDYGQVMLGATISTVPVIVFFLIFQKQFIAGILGGSVKE
ncbi:carbohydrate ABC transporter membrane protein 2 (CUT1 family) [Scopulibacillus darangshiensis]|uniref:Carbohydrate ABC transporter membrane protein 2 (CUT1 family) n=1 Tax=Scopulibacillus darangshiensis TaxID=442528 RepID=A0A4R2P644_9BACL|nr:carbohydrate ABC transporter permease [Scopulibacillus darangshiensis]TCP29614.1 carbohydrate ABC transporter membrane protein 2 (CUT1 family) [Scopulibacillus darangshiensis]